MKTKQEPSLKPYIERNKYLQRQAETKDKKIKKQNGKLRTNAVFGKLVETPIKKVDKKIVITRKH